LGDPGVNGRIILRCIFRKWGYGLDRDGSGQGQVAGTCECGNEPSGSHKMWRISRLAGWAPWPVWRGGENIPPPTGTRSPARSESLYRLSYPGPATNTDIRTISLKEANIEISHCTQSSATAVHIPPFRHKALLKTHTSGHFV
jgi:hypothetical protein